MTHRGPFKPLPFCDSVKLETQFLTWPLLCIFCTLAAGALSVQTQHSMKALEQDSPWTFPAAVSRSSNSPPPCPYRSAVAPAPSSSSAGAPVPACACPLGGPSGGKRG